MGEGNAVSSNNAIQAYQGGLGSMGNASLDVIYVLLLAVLILCIMASISRVMLNEGEFISYEFTEFIRSFSMFLSLVCRIMVYISLCYAMSIFLFWLMVG